MVKDVDGPVLLHVVTEKGHGYVPAEKDPVYFHTPPKFVDDGGKPIAVSGSSKPAYTNFASDAISDAMRSDERVTVLTAAMCQGNKLESVREEFASRFFDVGICESHAVAFAAGQCKAGLRPIVDIYSTFLQRSYDQIFQEVCLQNLPVVFMLDRAGLTGPDGPTHHGLFDIGYMRVFPNIAVMAPGYAEELGRMLQFALNCESPAAIRYPKCTALRLSHDAPKIELGKAEYIRRGSDVAIVSFGATLEQSIAAADELHDEMSITLVNARFAKPIDREMVAEVIENCGHVVTVEEGALQAGFGSAFLEAACDMGLDTRGIRRLGIPDAFVEHGERDELMRDTGIDIDAIKRACRGIQSPIAIG